MSSLPFESRPTDQLICSGQPSAQAFHDLANEGVSLVISLRPHSEYHGRDVPGEVKSAQLEYLNIPISSPADFTKDNAQKLQNAIDHSDGKILIFCGSSNRVGALLALKSFLFDGKTVDESLAFGEKSGLTALKPAVLNILNQLNA